MTLLIVGALAIRRLLHVWFLSSIARRPRLFIASLPRVGVVAGCEFCLSFWFGVLVVGMWQWPLGRALAWALALSELAQVYAMAHASLQRWATERLTR